MAKAKSKVNQAGNYTKPTMRKNLFNKINHYSNDLTSYRFRSSSGSA